MDPPSRRIACHCNCDSPSDMSDHGGAVAIADGYISEDFVPVSSGHVSKLVSEPGSMATNKERTEILEAGLGGVQDRMHRMEMSMSDEMHQLEETINRLSNALLSNKDGSSHGNTSWEAFSCTYYEENDRARQVFSSKMAKLEFPKYSGEDSIEWFNRVAQFFEFQNTPDNQRVSLASFHLEGEANLWW